MNKFFIAILLIGSLTSVNANSTYDVTLNFSVANTVKGHDFLSKFIIMVDGNPLTETKAQNQTTPFTITFPISYGRLNITIRFMSNINGVWEDRTAENHYTADKFSKANRVVFSPFIEKDTSFHFLFDLENNDFGLTNKSFPLTANIYSSSQPLPYKYADKFVSVDQLLAKEKVLEEYLSSHADKVIQIYYNQIQIGKKGTSNYDYTDIGNLKEKLEISPYNRVVFSCDENRSKLKSCFTDASTKSVYSGAYIYPKDVSKLNELHQKLSEFYDDVLAYYYREYATKDNTSEDVLLFDLQKKIDQLNNGLKYDKYLEGIEYKSDSLIFHMKDNHVNIIAFNQFEAIESELIGKDMKITLIGKNKSFYNSATNSYDEKMAFPLMYEASAKIFIENFTKFYNSVVNYLQTIGYNQAPTTTIQVR